jgi:hypothetical protein
LRRTNTLKPIVECKRCGKSRRTVLLGDRLCRPCHRREPKAKCDLCGKERRFVTAGAGLCPNCVKRAARPIEIECAKCGRIKPPATAHGIYCQSCNRFVSRGADICSGCGKKKSLANKRDNLCSGCNKDQGAPRKLQRLLDTLIISKKYNLTLFRYLVGHINWEKVDGETYARFKEFASFLQGHNFAGALTWGLILKLKIALPGKRYSRVRSCLEQLGELLLGPVKEDDLESHLRKRGPLGPISSFEASVVAVLEKYDLWLRTERKNTLDSRRNHFTTFRRFWKWCGKQGLTSLAQVEAAHVEEYLHTLGLKWTCRKCSFAKNITRRGEDAPTECENSDCRAPASFEKVIRCAGTTVRAQRARLAVFFGWLKDVERGIDINPAPSVDGRRTKRKKGWQKARKNPLTIQYYDWAVIDALFRAIQDPNMPAEEAMVLYLVLYHAFYRAELQTVRLPMQCRPIALGVESSQSLEDVLCLEWIPRAPSRGKQSLGRSNEILRLEPADEPWLRDLIRRYMQERNRKLRNPKNPYLFVGLFTSPRGGPVADRYFRRVIESATARVTGRACTIKVMGKCSRLIYSEFGGLEGFRHFRELGLGDQCGRHYAWAERVRMVPRQVNRTQTGKRSRTDLEVPAIAVFGNPTVRPAAE